jgi:hypothetical protein
MRHLLTVFSLLSLVSCSTPQSVTRASDYEVCRIALLQPPLLTGQTIAAAEQQVRSRRLDCSRYAGVIYQQQGEGVRDLQGISKGMMNTPNYGGTYLQGGQQSNTQTTNQKIVITCYKKGEYISGKEKSCVYNCQGSDTTLIIPAPQSCPLNLQR